MNKLITSYNISEENYSVETHIELPCICPHCNTGATFDVLNAFHIISNHNQSLYALFFCPTCDSCFIGEYDIGEDFDDDDETFFKKIFPSSSKITTFSQLLSSLSPKFVEIYNQAEIAENAGLTEICGLGYRKALEFLIKDFSIQQFPESEGNIKNAQLSKCIDEYIDSKRIKTLAKASAWIGNDETHYTRKHEDYGILHLKAFIGAATHFITSELSVLEAETLLETPK